jgi:hypothetical protein
VRLSDLAKTAIIGAAMGGVAFAPLALVNTQTAGATPENQLHVITTTDPEFYIQNDHALCVPIFPHYPTYVCVYRGHVGTTSKGP